MNRKTLETLLTAVIIVIVGAWVTTTTVDFLNRTAAQMEKAISLNTGDEDGR